MKSEIRFHILTAVAALASSLLAGYACSATATRSLASPESFAGIADVDHRAGRDLDSHERAGLQGHRLALSGLGGVREGRAFSVSRSNPAACL